MQQTILRAKQVAEKLGVSVSAVWYKQNPKSRHYDAAFPKPFKVSANITGWLESEIDTYIATLASTRSDTPNDTPTAKLFKAFDAACAYADELMTHNDVEISIEAAGNSWIVKLDSDTTEDK